MGPRRCGWCARSAGAGGGAGALVSLFQPTGRGAQDARGVGAALATLPLALLLGLPDGGMHIPMGGDGGLRISSCAPALVARDAAPARGVRRGGEGLQPAQPAAPARSGGDAVMGECMPLSAAGGDERVAAAGAADRAGRGAGTDRAAAGAAGRVAAAGPAPAVVAPAAPPQLAAPPRLPAVAAPPAPDAADAEVDALLML